MKRIILQEFVTVDGFATDPNGRMDFQQEYVVRNDKSFQEDAMRFLDSVDTMILGANTYRMFVGYWPEATGDDWEFAEKINSLSKFVVSSSLKNAPWGDWEAAEVISGNWTEEIAALKRQSGKDIVVWGSLTLARALDKEGLIDEYQFRVCPAALGNGIGIFPDDSGTLNLQLLEAKTYDAGMVLLRYQPSSGE